MQAEADSIIKEDSMGDDTAPVKKKKTDPPPKNTVKRTLEKEIASAIQLVNTPQQDNLYGHTLLDLSTEHDFAGNFVEQSPATNTIHQLQNPRGSKRYSMHGEDLSRFFPQEPPSFLCPSNFHQSSNYQAPVYQYTSTSNFQMKNTTL